MAEVSEKEYKRLKRQAEEAKTEHDRAQGQLEAAMERLEEEFECTTLKEADKLQKQLDKEAAEAEAEYEAARDEFEEQWAERVDDDE